MANSKNLGTCIGIVLAIGVAFVGYRLLHNSSVITADNTAKSRTASTMHFTQIEADLQAGGQLLDVRTPEEFKAGHVSQAINLPLGDLQNGVKPSVATDKPLYLYCRSGNRSAQAARILRAAGYTLVTDLGAMSHVKQLGGKVTIENTP